MAISFTAVEQLQENRENLVQYVVGHVRHWYRFNQNFKVGKMAVLVLLVAVLCMGVNTMA